MVQPVSNIVDKRIYLATPYTGVEELSFLVACEVGALLINQGFFVFSPISHSHPIWKTGSTDNTHDIWMRQDHEFVTWCDEVWVIKVEQIEDWNQRIENSRGVQLELSWARDYYKPIKYISYNLVTKSIRYEKG